MTDGGSAVLTTNRYEVLLNAAETHREALVVRLCGDVGLRPAEVVRLTPGCVRQLRADPPRYGLAIPASTESVDDLARVAYLPTRVERALRQYAHGNGIGDDDHLVPVTPRRVQMLVAEVSTRASERFDDPALETVSSRDLRQFFAKRALRETANPRAIKAAGDWQSFEALEPYLPSPTPDELVRAFEPLETAGTPDRSSTPSALSNGGRPVQERASEPAGNSTDDALQEVLERSDRYAWFRLDHDGRIDRWSDGAASLFGHTEADVIGSHVGILFPDAAVDEGVPDRLLETARDENGVDIDGWRCRADGSRTRVLETIVPVPVDADGSRRFVVLACQDSTPNHRFESARAVTAALLEASTHEAVETEVCRALVDEGPYELAWIDRTTASRTRREWYAANGLEGATIEHLQAAFGEATDVDYGDLDDGIVRTNVSTDGFDGTLLAVSVRYGDTVYGTLTLGTARETVGERERTWLETLGSQVGHTIAAVRRRNLLLSDAVVELDFACRDAASFFVDASARLDCRFELDSLVPIDDHTQLYYVHVTDATPAAVFEHAESDSGIRECRVIDTYADGSRLEFVVEGSSPALTLMEYGVTVLESVTRDGTTTITAECASDTDVRTVVDGLRAAFPASELVGKRQVERSVQTARAFRTGLEDRLTDRQEAALRAAYFGGYYDWPRESTAEEIADAMDVSSPTLHNHLRKGQHELLRTFFDGRP
ncbi:bacterio-opsin activator domain-containing protein [Natronosalvus halobius]|uniref:bacterio-opsin activator domain-containing protein n=1 Tax=Natronosalvus halobius TaxID=2953746 RepID=UPI0020A0989F|nr:bacterio-opsin activator domain-containing protein [Natronosalvus halobius]USZ70325.1 helix-turn-helix domain-containing protein [Natronosalvus halobius]